MCCPNCGKENKKNNAFCTNCGASMKKSKPSKRSKVKLFFGIALSLFGLLGICISIDDKSLIMGIMMGAVPFIAGLILIGLSHYVSFINLFSGSSKVKELSSEVARLNSELDEYRKNFSPEQLQIVDLTTHLTNEKVLKEQELANLNSKIEDLQVKLNAANAELIEKSDEAQLQDFGLFRPKYDLASSDEYKERLKEIRDNQKFLIRADSAVRGSTTWTVDGSASRGKKMVADMKKLVLRAFNTECDDLISRVKFNTFDTAEKRMKASFEAISKLGTMMNVSITNNYYQSKRDELRLALEYQIKKQQEKEEAKEARAQMREEAKLLREIEEERKSIRKEQNHYMRALDTILNRINDANDEELQMLIEKKAEIEQHLAEIEKNLQEIDYREANKRAGYVYIISNIGSFGENVYKIGMTRRLEPMDRVDELGDASVPFNFDVHAMIFSDDAPALEAALHKAFESKKVNMVNQRREFFNVTLDEIKEVVRQNYDKTVEFTTLPEAEQYRESIKIRESAD